MRSTKDLARELGCLRKRSSSAVQRQERSTKARQLFAYLVVIDFESTCWEDSKYRSQEIIEFPAVLLNTTTGKIESEFHYYVQPIENPVLSDFCKQLTGITQEQVEEGIPLSLVLTKFNQWLRRNREELRFVYNEATEDGTPRCTFVTWSDWDFGVCLQYEARRKQLRKPPELNSWIDLRATYRKFYARKPKGLNGALQDLGLDFEGREHSGLCDARNTARLTYRMICDGCVMTITKTMNAVQADGKHNSRNPGQENPIPAATSDASPSTVATKSATLSLGGTLPKSLLSEKKTQNESALTTKEVLLNVNKNGKRSCPVLPNTCTSLQPSTSRLGGNVQKSLVTKNFKPMTGSASAIMTATKTDSPVKKKSKMIQPISKSFSIYQDPGLTRTSSATTSTALKTNNLRNLTNITSTFNRIPSAESINKSRPPSLVKPSVSRTMIGRSTSFQGNLATSTVGKSTSFHGNSAFKTPLVPAVPATYSTMKATPPMCSCGRRSKRKFVQTPGPNQGRTFFCCGVVNKTATKGCKFFKWEPEGSQAIGASPQLSNYFKPATTVQKVTTSRTGPSFGVKIPQPDFNTPQTARTVHRFQGNSDGKKTSGFKHPGLSVVRPPSNRT